MVRKLIVLSQSVAYQVINVSASEDSKKEVFETTKINTRSKVFKVNTMKNNIIILALAALLSFQTSAQPKKTVTNYLGIEGPILFQKNICN